MNAEASTRTLPVYSWIGVALMVASQAGMMARIEPFHSWHTPFAWTGYILLVDGIIWKRRGSSWLRDSPQEFLFLAAVSVPLWVIFEMYNKYFIHNWYYVGLPESRPLRYLGYAWSFATIFPGIFETGELIASLRTSSQQPPAVVPIRLTPLAWTSVAAGAGMLLLPFIHPSTYLAAPVFLGFIFLLDPLNARAGHESLLGDRRQGRRDRLVNLLLAGLVCGVIWEFWNYWARAKWIYNVPILPDVKIFEMPLLGFGGFPPFALECFVMYVAVRRWILRRGGRSISV
jgi:hypothetical protein